MEEFSEISQNVSELRTQLGEYLSQERRRAQAGAQKFLLVLGAIPLVLLLLTAILLIGWVLVFYGVTEALAQTLGGKTWLAALIVGGTLLTAAMLLGFALWQWVRHRVKKAKAQAVATRQALRQSMQQAQGSAKQLASLQVWTEHYPLQISGIALLAGFALSGPLTARGARPISAVKSGDASATDGTPSPVFDRMQLWATLINTGADILKDVLTPVLQDMVQPQKQKRP
jgi:membrane protein implicated in regulation of membrane protease activity